MCYGIYQCLQQHAAADVSFNFRMLERKLAVHELGLGTFVIKYIRVVSMYVK